MCNGAQTALFVVKPLSFGEGQIAAMRTLFADWRKTEEIIMCLANSDPSGVVHFPEF